MNRGEESSAPKVTPELIAEASAWVAILHGPSRTSSTERGFARWVRRSESHSRAFEEATAIWEEARNLPRRSSWAQLPSGLGSKRERDVRRSWVGGLLVAAAVAGVAITLGMFLRASVVSTGIGEQRVLALNDGTRVILNTHTRVAIHYDDDSRKVDLKGGEALFEVAKDPNRPFIVTAGESRIRALGTSFNVRREENSVVVTLVHGKVTLSSSTAVAEERPGDNTALLAPGQRLTLMADRPPKLDTPQLDKLLAWQRREVALDNVTLLEAMAEMNRYSRKALVAELSDPDSIRTTGLFRAGDSISFARAVAAAYGLEVIEKSDRIVLSDQPTRPYADQ